MFGAPAGYRFTFVCHATANSFFTPTQNGIADACRLLGCSYHWAGSTSSNVAAMVAAIEDAVSAGVDGIATPLIDPTAFNQAIATALANGIPVVAYNADVPASGRLAYIGQDLRASGHAMGHRIIQLLPDGGEIAVFVATPGLLNLQPRVDGLKAALAHSKVTVDTVASGAGEAEEGTTIAAFVAEHTAVYRGFFAVDGGSTAAVAQAIQHNGLDQHGVVGGGFDLLPQTQQLLSKGFIQFAVDQQPYMQGFMAVVELFLKRASHDLTCTADVDTGIRLVEPDTVAPYAGSTSRYEGTATSPGVKPT